MNQPWVTSDEVNHTITVKAEGGPEIYHAPCPRCGHPVESYFDRGMFTYRDGCGHLDHIEHGGCHGLLYVFRKE